MQCTHIPKIIFSLVHAWLHSNHEPCRQNNPEAFNKNFEFHSPMGWFQLLVLPMLNNKTAVDLGLQGYGTFGYWKDRQLPRVSVVYLNLSSGFQCLWRNRTLVQAGRCLRWDLTGCSNLSLVFRCFLHSNTSVQVGVVLVWRCHCSQYIHMWQESLKNIDDKDPVTRCNVS